MDKLNVVNHALVSDELYDLTIGEINRNPMKYSHGYKTRIIHMIDSCSRGYITPMECYDAWKSKTFPIALELRPSKYQHLLK